MFSEVMPMIVSALREAGMPESQIDVLAQLGHCTQGLVHRGTIDVQTSYPDAPSFPAGDTDLGWGPNYFENHTSEYNTETGNVDGGYTINAPGVSYFTTIITTQIVNPTTDTAYTEQTVEVVTDYRYDTASHKLQKKTRSITFLGTMEDESDWTDVHTAEELTYVVNEVSYSVSTGELEQTRSNYVYVLDAGTSLSAENIDTADEC